MTSPPSEERPSLGKVFEAINAVATDVATMKVELRDLADHERRIRALESRMYGAVGIVGAIALITPFITRLIP